jgi:hypothetical protein
MYNLYIDESRTAQHQHDCRQRAATETSIQVLRQSCTQSESSHRLAAFPLMLAKAIQHISRCRAKATMSR